jgi:RNA polymerase sigma-70 factor (ECF subfamily)
MRALASLETAVVEQPRAWVLTIVRNTTFSWLAKNRPKAVVLIGDPQLFEAATAHRDSAPDPEEALIAAADESALKSAIEALPHIFKEVIVMRDINGMSYREIAAAIGAPQGTVMSRLARARAQLVEKLGSRV